MGRDKGISGACFSSNDVVDGKGEKVQDGGSSSSVDVDKVRTKLRVSSSPPLRPPRSLFMSESNGGMKMSVHSGGLVVAETDAEAAVRRAQEAHQPLSSAMDGLKKGPTVSFKNKINRPDSLRLELICESARSSCVFPESQRCANEQHLGFRELSYSVRSGLFKTGRKTILKKLNGDFFGGSLSAIMGPSGAGKTSLMQILAGYQKMGVTGQLQMNYEPRNETVFRKKSCYIMQDDQLQPLLTVAEAMTIAANLKLPHFQKSDREKRIQEILTSLALWECRQVRTSKLSGGQRKRVAIALELVKNPQVMFFDEPTSGLDSSTTKQCIKLLKELAQEGRIIICTIHQPSAIVFEMFDHLYAMAQGFCTYQGSIKGLLPYLGEIGLHCPPYHNPADYLLEVNNGDHGDYTEILAKKSENGLNNDWRKINRDTLEMASIEHIDKMIKSGLMTPVKAPMLSDPMDVVDNKENGQINGTNTTKKKKKKKKEVTDTTFLRQLYILIKRTFVTLSRDRSLTYSRLGTHFFIAICIGILYYDVGEDASNVLNNFNYLFFTLMFLMYTAFSCVITTFPLELPVVVREHFNKWYSLKSYFLAVTIADLPVQIISTLLYSITTYLMTSQPLEYDRLLLFHAMCILVSLVAQSLGFLVGAALDIKYGVIFGPFFIMPFVVFAGFFVHLPHAHPWLQWLFHLSFLKYGFEGLLLPIFGYNRAKLPCNADYCHFVYPSKFLDEVDMANASYLHSVIFLVCLGLLLRIMTFITLKIQMTIKR